MIRPDRRAHLPAPDDGDRATGQRLRTTRHHAEVDRRQPDRIAETPRFRAHRGRLPLEPPQSAAIVSRVCVWVALGPEVLPPASDRVDLELRRFVFDADVDRLLVELEVMDAIGDCPVESRWLPGRRHRDAAGHERGRHRRHRVAPALEVARLASFPLPRDPCVFAVRGAMRQCRRTASRWPFRACLSPAAVRGRSGGPAAEPAVALAAACRSGRTAPFSVCSVHRQLSPHHAVPSSCGMVRSPVVADGALLVRRGRRGAALLNDERPVLPRSGGRHGPSSETGQADGRARPHEWDKPSSVAGSGAG